MLSNRLICGADDRQVCGVNNAPALVVCCSAAGKPLMEDSRKAVHVGFVIEQKKNHRQRETRDIQCRLMLQKALLYSIHRFIINDSGDCFRILWRAAVCCIVNVLYMKCMNVAKASRKFGKTCCFVFPCHCR